MDYSIIDRYRLLAMLLPLFDKEGISLTPDRYIRLFNLMNLLPIEVDIDDLVNYLCPIFVVSEHQQHRFREFFFQIMADFPRTKFLIDEFKEEDNNSKYLKKDTKEEFNETISQETQSVDSTSYSWQSGSNKEQNLALNLENCTEPPYTWKIVADENISLDVEIGLGQKTTSLRSREVTENIAIDLTASIQSTIRHAGMPVLCFKYLTRPVEYLLLIERISTDDHRALLFDKLWRILRNQEILIERFFHDGDIRNCYNEQFPTGISLRELRYRYINSRLIVLGNGYRMLNAQSGKISDWTSKLMIWNSRTLLTPAARFEWGIREYRLRNIFMLLPASWEGFQFASKDLRYGESTRYKDLPVYVKSSAEFPRITVASPIINILKEQFGTELSSWIAICAIWPSLHFDLTLRLGKLLSTPNKNLLTFENITRISSIPWFVNGFIPIEYRNELLMYLEVSQPELLKRVTAYLYQLLTENPPDYQNSHAFAEHQINIAILTLAKFEGDIEAADKKLRTALKYLEKNLNLTDFILPLSMEKLLNRLNLKDLASNKSDIGRPPSDFGFDRQIRDKKELPWALDGIRYFDKSEPQYSIVRNHQIEKFLSIGNHDDMFFLIGPSGVGKSTLLRYKSYLYRTKTNNSFKFNTYTNKLVDRLQVMPENFSAKDRLGFRQIDDWETLWNLTLFIMISKICGLKTNSSIDKLIGKTHDFSTVFSILISNRNMLSKFKKYEYELFSGNISEVSHGVLLFIDDVDIALSQLLTNHDGVNFDNPEVSDRIEIWQNAQNALMNAIYRLYRINAHIKVFASIRSEAFLGFNHQLKPNFEHHSTILSYNKEEIKDIFIANIQMIPRSNLLFPYGQTPIERFLGFDNYFVHPFVMDNMDNPRTELVFDFIFRHTFGRPREIIQMGRSLHELVTKEEYREANTEEKGKQVRAVINKVSHEIFEQYRAQIIFFNNEEFIQFVKSVPSNVFDNREMQNLSPVLVRKYYNLGLIGYVRHMTTGSKIQTFLSPSKYNFNSFYEIPNSEYYLLHPTLDHLLIQLKTYSIFYNKNCIVGDGYEFYLS